MEAQVAIVGAGPAGALLAYLLASRGIETLLIERQSDFSREFRGEVLMPSGIRALTEAGVSLEDVSTRVPELLEGYLNGQRFLEVDSSILGNVRPTVVSQPELLESLVALAERTGKFQFRRGHAVRGLTRNDDGKISMRVSIAGADQEENLRVPFVVGADGRSSVVRRHIGHRVRAKSTPLDVIWFKLPYPGEWPQGRLRFEFGKGHLLIALCASDGLLQVAWVILKGTYRDFKKKGIEAGIDEMSRHADEQLARHIEENRDRLKRPFLLNAVTDRVIGWSAPGSLLIGDAAHTMSPVGAQGINLALRDSIVAANALVPAFRQNLDLDRAAAEVEILRRPEIDRIQSLAAVPPRILMGRTFLHDAARRGLAFLAANAPRPLGATRVASMFLEGVTDVELKV